MDEHNKPSKERSSEISLKMGLNLMIFEMFSKNIILLF